MSDMGKVIDAVASIKARLSETYTAKDYTMIINDAIEYGNRNEKFCKIDAIKAFRAACFCVYYEVVGLAESRTVIENTMAKRQDLKL